MVVAITAIAANRDKQNCNVVARSWRTDSPKCPVCTIHKFIYGTCIFCMMYNK